MSGFVYLITELDKEKYYKIGCTKKKDIEERKKELQTGNSSPLHIITHFKTEAPYKLEKMLHQYYANKCKLNEWYELTTDEVLKFTETCSMYENIIKSLQDNPFFNNKKETIF